LDALPAKVELCSACEPKLQAELDTLVLFILDRAFKREL
jgi:hypothetical protein